MAPRAGSANLPLHGGRVPLSLADRMTRLSTVIRQAIVHHYGRDELPRRLAHPFWFQSFGAVMGMDWLVRRLHATLVLAAERGPVDFPYVLLTPGVGARTVRALMQVADPARLSLAHGGKDGHPFSAPLRVYDETNRVLKSAVQNAKLGRDKELAAIKRLDEQARLLERHASGSSVEELLARSAPGRMGMMGGRYLDRRGRHNSTSLP
jgi:hypothetical protein